MSARFVMATAVRPSPGSACRSVPVGLSSLGLVDVVHGGTAAVMTNAGEVCILITSIFLSVVLLRACWMQGTEKCMEDGDATVCTCSADLCNSSPRLQRTPAFGLFGLVGGPGPMASLAFILTILHVILTAALAQPSL